MKVCVTTQKIQNVRQYLILKLCLSDRGYDDKKTHMSFFCQMSKNVTTFKNLDISEKTTNYLQSFKHFRQTVIMRWKMFW